MHSALRSKMSMRNIQNVNEEITMKLIHEVSVPQHLLVF
jgi:hypothetical protein